MQKTFPPWETELRALTREELRNDITSGTSDQKLKLMWARNPLRYVETQATNALLESWELFPAWRIEYEKTSRRGQLHLLWGTLDVDSKTIIAKAFAAFYLKQKRPKAR